MGIDEKIRLAALGFRHNGYVIIHGAFSRYEARCLREAILRNEAMTKHAEEARRKFEAGKYPSFETIFVWNDTSGSDIFAKFTRRKLIFQLLQEAFEDEVYVYHNKVAVKYQGMPGFRYHQDYAYWYSMGCLYPDMATCYIAVDQAVKENGCLKILEGSHKMGRIEHVFYDGPSDSGVEEERFNALRKRLIERYIELEPGDCVVFHANTLHGSDPNYTPQSRLALLGCYNTWHNEPYLDHEHPKFIRQTPIEELVTEADIDKLPDFSLHYKGAR